MKLTFHKQRSLVQRQTFYSGYEKFALWFSFIMNNSPSSIWKANARNISFWIFFKDALQHIFEYYIAALIGEISRQPRIISIFWNKQHLNHL